MEKTSSMTSFNEALDMLIEPNPLPMDWDNYYEAAREIGMDTEAARDYLYNFRATLGLVASPS